jgi:quinol monooxygenase YgiN
MPQVKISAILTARPGKAGALNAMLFAMAPYCRAEPGNLRWDIWRDRSDPDRYVLDELYVDAESVEEHRRSAHYEAYLAKVPELAERIAVICDPALVEGDA